MTDGAGYDAVVLAGGFSRRMGGRDKCAQDVAGRALLDRAIDAVADARRVVVVGPERPTSRPVHWIRERPAGTGPVAAIAAGLEALEPTGVVVVLAGDLPFAAAAVPRLVARLDEDSAIDATIAVDEGGRDQYLLAAYDAASLARVLGSLDPTGASMKKLIQLLRVDRLSVAGPTTLDCDTPEDLQRARDLAAGVNARAGEEEL